MRYYQKNKKGFTLIELILVASIIALLSSIVISVIEDSKKKSRDARRVVQMQQVATALELYHSENSEYPQLKVESANFPGNLETQLSSHISFIPDDPLNLDRSYYGEYGSLELTTLFGCGRLPNSNNPPGFILAFATEGTLGTKALDLYSPLGKIDDIKCLTSN